MKKILLIDDDELVRYSLVRGLEQFDYQIVELENGLKALKAIESEQPDIMITDLIMPEQEGIATIRQVHKSYPNLSIIAISGGGRNIGAEHLDIAQALGASATLSKPLDIQELNTLIEQLT